MNRRTDSPARQVVPRSGAHAPRWSVRTFLVGLVLACLLPGIIGATVLLVLEYRQGRAQLEKDTLQTARALGRAVDNQILRVQSLALGLAAADSLAQGDFAAFHRQARRVLADSTPGTALSLALPSGEQILNTGRPFGAALPRHGNPALVRRVALGGKPAISDLFVGGVIGRPIMVVAVPVFRGRQVAQVLTISVLPEEFAAILDAQGLPEGWVATILDGASTIVARSRESEKYSGQKPASGFLALRGDASEGALEFVMKDGVSVVSHYTRSPLTHWSVAVNIPQESLRSHLFNRFSMMLWGIPALFAIGLGFAWLIGGRITRSFRALRAPAFALGAGESFALPAVEVREAAEVTRAMGEAAALLEKRRVALRRAEIQLQMLVRHAPAAIAVFDRDMRYLAVSRRWQSDYGLSEDEVVGKSHFELFPGLPERWKDAYRRGMSGEVVRFRADRLEVADGSVQWAHWELWPWRDDSGAVGGIVVASEDITAQKRMEMAVEESERHLRQLIAALPGMVWTATPAGAVDFVSRQWLDYTGASRESQLGEGFLACLHPEDREAVAGIWREAVACRSAFDAEYRLRRRDGSYRWFKSRATPMLEEDGRVGRWLGVVIDITAEKEVETTIRRLNAELEKRVAERTAELVAANRELEGFTFATSHDLRGPLGRINSFSALLEQRYRDRLEGEGLLYLDFIRQNATRLTALVDDLLAHARVAQQSLELQPVDVRGLVQSVLQDKADDLLEAGALLQVELPPARVAGDPQVLGQALGNLVENAVKYSALASPPRIEIGGRQDGRRLRLWVRDNGIGFDMAYHDRIFEMFRRLHTHKEYAGSGVGLALVKCAAERMGGKVWAESEPGRGATFFLEFETAE